MRRACAADVIVGGCALVLCVADIHLYRHDQRLITDTLRRPLVLAWLCTLCLHALDVLGFLDPFRAAARLIPRRTPYARHVP